MLMRKALTKGGLLDLLETQDGLVDKLFGLFFADLILKVESSSFYYSH